MDATGPGLSSDIGKKGATGPGLYSEIGKKARDLLYKDCHTDQKFTLTTYAQNGAGVPSKGQRTMATEEAESSTSSMY